MNEVLLVHATSSGVRLEKYAQWLSSGHMPALELPVGRKREV